MITKLNSKRIYRGFDSLKFNEIRKLLSENDIEYRQKVLSFATYSESADPTEYRIYIRRKDLDKAELLNILNKS